MVFFSGKIWKITTFSWFYKISLFFQAKVAIFQIFPFKTIEKIYIFRKKTNFYSTRFLAPVWKRHFRAQFRAKNTPSSLLTSLISLASRYWKKQYLSTFISKRQVIWHRGPDYRFPINIWINIWINICAVLDQHPVIFGSTSWINILINIRCWSKKQ